MQCLIVEPNAAFAEQIALLIKTTAEYRCSPNKENIKILGIPKNSSAGEIAENAENYIKEHGKPSAIFLTSELPCDGTRALKIVAWLGEYAPVILIGKSCTRIIDAAQAQGGAPECIAASVSNPANISSILTALTLARMKNLKIAEKRKKHPESRIER